MRSIYDLLLAVTIAVLSPPIRGVLDGDTALYNDDSRCDPCLHQTVMGKFSDGLGPLSNLLPAWGGVLSFLTQFSYAGGALCELFLAFDMAVNFTNPFTNFRESNKRYFTLSLLGALFSATLLVCPVWPNAMKHDTSYELEFWESGNGLFSLGFCWAGSQRGRLFNSAMWVLFVVPITFNLIANVVVYLCARTRLNRGLSRTFIVRLVVLRMTNHYVIASFVWTALMMLSYIATQTPFYIEYFTTNYSVVEINAYGHVAANIAAFITTSKGVLPLIIWIYWMVQFSSLERSNKLVAIGDVNTRERNDTTVDCGSSTSSSSSDEEDGGGRQQWIQREERESEFDELARLQTRVREMSTEEVSGRVSARERKEIQKMYDRKVLTIQQSLMLPQLNEALQAELREFTSRGMALLCVYDAGAVLNNSVIRDPRGGRHMYTSASNLTSGRGASWHEVKLWARGVGDEDGNGEFDPSSPRLPPGMVPSQPSRSTPSLLSRFLGSREGTRRTRSGNDDDMLLETPLINAAADIPDERNVASNVGVGSLQAGGDRTAVLAAPSTTSSAECDDAKPLGRHDAVVRTYAPKLFRRLREVYAIDPNEFRESVRLLRGLRRSEGKSGAFTFTTMDQRFIIKTLTKGEFKFFMTIIEAYVNHLTSCREASHGQQQAGPYAAPSSSSGGAAGAAATGSSSSGAAAGAQEGGTLISKIFALYSIDMYFNRIYFCVMQNAFPPKGSIQEMYDLKGSKTDRSATRLKDGAVATCKYCEKTFVVGTDDELRCKYRARCEGIQLLKDNDLDYKILLSGARSHAVKNAIARDTAFLKSQGIMDYSLLLGTKRRRFPLSRRFGGASPVLKFHSLLKVRTAAMSEGEGGADDELLRQFKAMQDECEVFPVGGDDDNDVGDGDGSAASIRISAASSSMGTSLLSGDYVYLNTSSDAAQYNALWAEEALMLEAPSQYYLAIIVSLSLSLSLSIYLSLSLCLTPKHSPPPLLQDILQEWNLAKRFENVAKRLLLCKGSGISCVEPELYRARFVKYTSELFEELDNVILLEHTALPRRDFDEISDLLTATKSSSQLEMNESDGIAHVNPDSVPTTNTAAASQVRVIALARGTKPTSMFLVDVGDVTRSADLIQCCRQRLAGVVANAAAAAAAGVTANGREAITLVAAHAGRRLPRSRRHWAALKQRWQQSSEIPRVTVFTSALSATVR